MNKTKMILAVTGGAIGLVVLGMALFVWFAVSERTVAIEGDDEEGIEGLESVLDAAQTLGRKSVYPCAANVAAIESNRTQVADWQRSATALAARGDRVFEKTTPAAFKAFIVSDARRLSGKPGAAEGRLTKPSFDFGPFKDYISGGKLPAEGDLAALQRKWDDVATVTEALAASGIAELTDVQFKEKKDTADDKRRDAASPKNKNRNAQSDDSATPQPVAFSYVFTFTAKPSALVKAINALATGERFTVVDNFTLNRSADTLFAAMGSEGKVEAKQASSGRHGRRRGGNAAAAEVSGKETAAPQNAVVADPSADSALLTVVLTVTVHDFGTLTGEAASSPLQKEEK